MIDAIRDTIEAAIEDAEAIVSDPYEDGQHFEAIVISQSFTGMLLMKQHQLVLNALKDALHNTVHAIKIKTYTPDSWERLKGAA